MRIIKLILSVSLLGFLFLGTVGYFDIPHAPTQIPIQAPAPPQLSQAVSDIGRVVAEHPVIAAGIYSKDALYVAYLKYALYSDFDVESAHLIQLPSDMFLKSSYAINGKILWTQHAIRIPKGTWVWEDKNQRLIEARCGNLLQTLTIDPVLSDIPDAPYTLASPPAFVPVPDSIQTLDSPTVSINTPSASEPPSYNPPGFVSCCAVFIPPVSVSPIYTPESDTFSYLLFGLLCLALGLLIRKRTM